MSQEMIANPFSDRAVARVDQASSTDLSAGFLAGGGGSTMTEQTRALAEVQTAMVIAKRFPRNQLECMDRILQACTRYGLAEKALYIFPRGNEMVTGMSAPMANSLAQEWGNIEFGWRELALGIGSDGNAYSEIQAYAWDIERNVRKPIVFHVRHWRDTKRGGYPLKDERDIYELLANQAARRVRACILSVIPGDVQEAALKQCELTLMNKGGAPQEQIKKLIEAFAEFGVTPELIAQRLKHHLTSVNQAEVVNLRKMYTSIKDGMAKPGDFFEMGDDAKPVAASGLNDKLSKAVKSAVASVDAAAPQAEPAAA